MDKYGREQKLKKREGAGQECELRRLDPCEVA